MNTLKLLILFVQSKNLLKNFKKFTMLITLTKIKFKIGKKIEISYIIYFNSNNI